MLWLLFAQTNDIDLFASLSTRFWLEVSDSVEGSSEPVRKRFEVRSVKDLAHKAPAGLQDTVGNHPGRLAQRKRFLGIHKLVSHGRRGHIAENSLEIGPNGFQE